MNFLEKLEKAMEKNDSLVCVGLDPNIDKLSAQPKASNEPLFAFNKAIIDATHDLVCAYKPNSAFYEMFGDNGIRQLKQTCDYIRAQHPDIPIILDAKRGDIGNTNDGYVAYAYEYLGADAVTLHPYMGQASLQPFLDQADKGAIILCQTSNDGAGEFQSLQTGELKLYQKVAENVAKNWNTNGNCLLVTGATYPGELAEIRQIVGDEMVLLVPGIGSQGGDIEAVLKAGLNTAKKGLIISASRSILYASNDTDFTEAARSEADKLRTQINQSRNLL